MIRRDIRLADGAPGWMLVSQIEHARLSSELARHCIAPLGHAPERAGSSSTPATPPVAIRDEVLAAIQHHDDGWAAWEQTPQLDAVGGRPLSFTEVGHADAMTIWSRSIEAGARIGPLAASMVAGHFLRLSRFSAAASAELALANWQASIASRRDAWLAEWRQLDPAINTQERADSALKWLRAFDEISLWLCCKCDEDAFIPCAPGLYCAGRGTPVEMELSAAEDGAALARPWRFEPRVIEVTISVRSVPAVNYRDAAQLLAASVRSDLRWRLAGEKNLLETGAERRS